MPAILGEAVARVDSEPSNNAWTDSWQQNWSQGGNWEQQWQQSH